MSSMLKVSEDEYLPLRDVVFNTLRQAIIKGELKPGERLLEIQLADKLGVSRTPIREAIRKLELEGLVTMIPRRGATVAGITKKHLQDVLEIRRALERLAVELACERMDAEGLEQLEALQQQFIDHNGSDDVFLLANIDEKFHDTIYQSTLNERLVSMLENLREQMYRYRLEYIKDSSKRDLLVNEHNLIIDAIRQKDAEAAKDIISRHIYNQEIAVLNTIDK